MSSYTFYMIYLDETTYLLFRKCKEIIDGVNQKHAMSNYNGDCNISDYQDSDIFNSNINEICSQSLAYLNKVYNERQDYSLDKFGFKYLYYWLYKYKLKGGKTRAVIKNFYEKLLNIFNTYYKNLSYQTDYQSVTEDVFEKFNDLDDMHNSLILIGKKCKPNENDSYCTKILDIMNKYNPQNKIEHDETCTGKELHNCKNNIVEAIIIPIF
ncbi:variable surface protein, partial [Plasmodium gonderi]